MFCVDRLEGDIAILIDDNEKVTKVKKDVLPYNIKEGDRLYINNGKYEIDIKETAKMIEDIKKMLNNIWD